MERIVIVGGSVAGVTAAGALRGRGFDGQITVVDADPHQPYDKPPLSKRILTGQQAPGDIALRRPEALSELRLDHRTGTRATALDPVRRRVTVVHDGTIEELPYDGLIIATGSAARHVPAWEELDGVQTLRTLDDALALKARLDSGNPKVVIIGAGFIGLEVASSAHALGRDVTVVEPLSAPVVRGLGERMGHVIAAKHRTHGIDIRLGVGVSALTGTALTGTAQVEQVVLADGTTVEADIVIVGIGASPVTDWLNDSGLAINDGIVCDSTLAAGPAGVYAAGDVARWPNELLGETIRVEHWTNAADQGHGAAGNLLETLAGGTGTPFAEVPFFWSDQAGGRIQFLGRAGPDDRIEIVHGATDQDRFVALYGNGERLTAALGFSSPRLLMPYKALLASGVSWHDALEFAGSQ
jgi:NADPH-dependent 2,4-dienoyl-CoA reductase/sulfur reductase-like enzyme